MIVDDYLEITIVFSFFFLDCVGIVELIAPTPFSVPISQES